MTYDGKVLLADTPAALSDPLSYALAMRDAGVVDMVRQAIRRGNIRLAFQPVVSAANPDRILFHEGLIRVLDKTGRIIPAAEFITAIETTETGRIIDCLALERGLKVLATHRHLKLSINLSARSIGYHRWMRTLQAALATDPGIGRRLLLEITETSAMTVPELVTGFMDELYPHGITFALDDFGAGFTSLRYLKDFNFDILKIDGHFIRGIARQPDSQCMVKAVMSIARNFDMLTIAEHVENGDDARYLAELGVDCLQGYHFGVPTIRPAWLSGQD